MRKRARVGGWNAKQSRGSSNQKAFFPEFTFSHADGRKVLFESQVLDSRVTSRPNRKRMQNDSAFQDK